MRLPTVLCSLCLGVLLATGPIESPAQGGLTPQEQSWIAGVRPVLEQAVRAGLPVDIVVQPQPTQGLAPIALAFVDGRCKLVFSMRENTMVQKQEQRIAQHLGDGRASLDAALELMAAHELFGHCARHVAGQWHAVPEGYAEDIPDGLPQALHADFTAMRATRREEGYADLAALTWARAHRLSLYPRLHAWLTAERSHELMEGSHHDTLAWLRSDGAGHAAVAEVWRDVLLEESGSWNPGGRGTSTAQR